MPAGYAHYIFGEKVLDSLDDQYKQLINQHIDLYHIGIHGPDILFYYKTLTKNNIKHQGSLMHQNNAYDFFKEAKLIINNSSDKDSSLCYIYGFITHFVLDHSCHPYIRLQEKELNMTHSEIESELDRKLLVNQGLNPISTSLTKHIHVNDYISSIIAPFFHLKDKDIYQSLKDLLFYLGWIKAPSKIKRYFVYFCMKIGGIYKEYKGLIINYKENKKSKECTYKLLEIMDECVPLAKALIEEYIDNELNDIYHNNYE
jgi:hypothetical protein